MSCQEDREEPPTPAELQSKGQKKGRYVIRNKKEKRETARNRNGQPSARALTQKPKQRQGSADTGSPQ